MKMPHKKSIFTAILIFLLPLIASAQAFMLEDWPADRARITFKYLHPNLTHILYQNDLSVYSGNYYLSLNLPVKGNPRLNLEATLPLLVNHLKTEPIYGKQRETMIGSLYLGFQYKLKSTTPKKGTTLSAGVYLGTTPDNKYDTYFMALYTNFIGFAGYQAHELIPTFNIASYRVLGHFRFGWEAGPAILFETENAGYIDPFLYLHYGVFGSFQTAYVTLRAELAGFMIVAGDKEHLNMSPDTNTVAVGAHFNRGRFRPGVFYKKCLVAKNRREVKDVLGFQIQFLL